MSHFPTNPHDRIQSLSAEVARLTAELAAIRTGDTCGRQCEGTAYRITARTLKAENERLTAELATANEWNERYAIELRELREQKPVAFLGAGGVACRTKMHWTDAPLYARPVPAAQAVPEQFRYKFKDRAALEAFITSGGLQPIAAAPQPPNCQEDCAELDIDPAFAEAVYGHDLDLTAMVGGAQ